ncbi:MAG: 50S ribosomal protein L21 [Candidatus Parcubacteria bacterium]|nr:MAG: 50S ribosomal protein L21 [Candidatus Parcubacteria bacterium]
MKIAIFKTGGKQYLVEEGAKIEIEKLKNKNKEDKLIFDEVLLYADDNDFLLGRPYLKNVVVEASLVREKKNKILIIKYRPKTRYRKKSGHKKITWIVKIEKIQKV